MQIIKVTYGIKWIELPSIIKLKNNNIKLKNISGSY